MRRQLAVLLVAAGVVAVLMSAPVASASRAQSSDAQRADPWRFLLVAEIPMAVTSGTVHGTVVAVQHRDANAPTFVRVDGGGWRVTTSDPTFTLYGDVETGWGNTSGGETIPGPTLAVMNGDVVTMELYSDDMLPHRFFIDYNGNNVPDSGEPTSEFFTNHTTFVFTADTTGSFTYFCQVHPATMYGSWTTNPPETVHDIAVTSVNADKTTVTQGETVGISVSVKNQGNVQDTTTVTAFANAAALGNQVVTLTPGQTQGLTFPWDTTTFPPGAYTISASASVVPGETNTSNNQMTDGTVTVNPPPPPGAGDLVAVLAGRSAWPDHHHFPISRFGTTQTLFGKVANVGPGPVNAMVKFTIRDDGGSVVGVVDSNSIVIPVGGLAVVTASWTVTTGKFHVTAQCWFDSNDDGTFDGFDPNTKTFSFTVVP